MISLLSTVLKAIPLPLASAIVPVLVSPSATPSRFDNPPLPATGVFPTDKIASPF